MNDQDPRGLEALRALVREGDASGPGVPATEVFDEARKMIVERRRPAE